MARRPVLHCNGPRCRYHPVLGVFRDDGSLRVKNRSVQVVIESGDILLGCVECGTSFSLTLPLQNATAECLGLPVVVSAVVY